jgi:hypothetical protein
MVLALKLVLTPAVVVVSTLAGRRFGRAVSGWLIGLPLTSGPVAAFFAVEQGRRFAARAAVGSLGGAIGEVAFCAAYTAGARRGGPRRSLALGSLAFAVAAAVLRALDLPARPVPVVSLGAAATLALLLGFRLVPRMPQRASVRLESRWDVPVRAVVATGFLLALTGLAAVLGPALAGVLAVYPLYSAVLAAFAQRAAGAAAAVQVLRGLLVGLFSFVAFYLALALLLPRLAIAPAFTSAFAACFAVQALSLVPLLRARKAADQLGRLERDVELG